MFLQFILLLGGLALVTLGANCLVDGSSSIARKAGLSEFVIGLTIVGIGTSTPEMVVSFTGAIKGVSDISVGNIVGSNIFNVFIILGVTALIRPMAMTKGNVREDLPLNLMVTLLLIALGLNKTIFGFGAEDGLSRIDGVIFLVLFAAYMAYSFKTGKEEGASETEGGEKVLRLSTAIIFTVSGLALLIFGGRVFVDSAENIALHYGISEKFIAITILAGGTSLPELITCVVAAAKNKGQLALGNIIGSNISNILLILGGSALIHPLSFCGMTVIDLSALTLGALLIYLSAFVGKKRLLDRPCGVTLLLCEAVYMTYLIIKL